MFIGAVIVTIIALKRAKAKAGQGIDIVLPEKLAKEVSVDDSIEEEPTETTSESTETTEKQ